ncbi:MAG TPA: nucleotidyltransferase domain-containing protein [Thermomicrobiaceae bacterium]|nr:nucleotidyltransferase domain-containing protein [Thermomicrobiaceae bacterium]
MRRREFSTGHSEVDAALDRAIAVLDAALPGRMLGLYLFGSYAEGSAVPTSDLDLFVVLRGRTLPAEAARAAETATRAIGDGPPLPDVLVLEEAALLGEGHFRLETASALVAGEDVRDRLPPTTPARWLHRYSQAPVDYMAGVLRRVDRLTAPVDYPDPTGEFYGYDAPTLPPRGGPAHNVKSLVATICWIASVLAAMESGQLARTKAEGVARYRADVGGAWAGLVEDAYQWGKGRWSYLVPAGREERARLRDLCARTLAFENHYLDCYRDYLLGEADGADPAGRLLAVEQLGRRLCYPGDVAVRSALAVLATSGDAALAARAAEASPRA